MTARLALALVALLLAGCGTAAAPTPQIIYVTPAPTPTTTPTAAPTASPTPAPTSHPFRAISGTFFLLGVNGTNFISTSDDCQGSGGYADVRSGLAVTAKDESGKIIASSVIKFSGGNTGVCGFSFTLLDVPEAAFYSVEVGHRGALTFSKADLEAAHWHVDLTLGK